MNVNKEINVICETLKFNETKLASELGVTYETINHWLNGRKIIDKDNLEKLYSYAYDKGIQFNNIYEQFYKEDFSHNQYIVLFHGAKKNFSLPINFKEHTKNTNDFGPGFYMGETFEQAANYISFVEACTVYCFKLKMSHLRVYKFAVNTEWMLAIAYFRGWIDEYKNTYFMQEILNKIKDCDVIIAPIADNRMFDIIAEFTEGTITDEQCQHSLAATNLGLQYVLKTDKALQNTDFIQEMYVCQKEKEKCIKNRISITENGMQKVRMARIQYKGKGQYIEEILK